MQMSLGMSRISAVSNKEEQFYNKWQILEKV